MSYTLGPRTEVRLSENEWKIATLVAMNAPISYKEVVGKYNDAEKEAKREPVSLAYVAGVLNELVEKGVISAAQQGHKKVAQLADGVEITETSAFVPSGLAPTPEDRLKQVLSLFNVKGDTQQKVISILGMNPAMDNEQSLFGVLTNLRVEPSIARNIVGTYYGAQQYAALASAAAARGGFFPPGMYPGYPGYPPPSPPPYGYPQPQPMMYQQTPQGLVPVMMAGPSVPPAQQPAPQPVIIKTGETRKVRRPMTDKDGNVKKDPETKEPLYEETEEPVVLTAGAGGGTEGMLLKLLLESGGLGGGKYREKYEEEKEKRVADQIEQVKKESSENIQGLVASVNKNQAELVKVMTDSMEKMQHSWEDKFKDMAKDSQHAAELAAARGSAGERPIVSITKEVSKTVREGFEDVRSTIQGMYRPGLPGMPQGPGPAPPMTEEQMLAAARDIRDKAQPRTQHA